MRQLADGDVCELNGKPVFEIRRTEAGRLKTQAELYTYDGSFLRSSNQGVAGLMNQSSGMPITFGGPGGMLQKSNELRAPGVIFMLGAGTRLAVEDWHFFDAKIAFLVLSGKVSDKEVREICKPVSVEIFKTSFQGRPPPMLQNDGSRS